MKDKNRKNNDKSIPQSICLPFNRLDFSIDKIFLQRLADKHCIRALGQMIVLKPAYFPVRKRNN